MLGSLCFVIMPFRPARLPRRAAVDFDGIYRRVIAPAVEQAGLTPHRADEETEGGIFHKTMFERLALCEFCVADVSRANPNVYYELGVRHAFRPWSTVLLYCDDSPLPLDIAAVSAVPYPPSVLDDDGLVDDAIARLVQRLRVAQSGVPDSPVFQLVAGLATPELDHGRAESVLEAMHADSELGRRIADASAAGLAHVRAIRTELASPQTMTLKVTLSLLLTFRSHEAWAEMVDLVDSAPSDFAGVWLVQEQYALALGRLERFREAAGILQQLLAQRANAETWGLLGGIYRREWESLLANGASPTAVQGALDETCEAYVEGFAADSRDPYPGVNAVTFLLIAGRRKKAKRLMPVVRYAVDSRLASPHPEFWDYAADLQLVLLEGRLSRARRLLPRLIRAAHTPFETDSLIDGLRVLAAHLPDVNPRTTELIDDASSTLASRRRELGGDRE